jgi:hypothetical protein
MHELIDLIFLCYNCLVNYNYQICTSCQCIYIYSADKDTDYTAEFFKEHLPTKFGSLKINDADRPTKYCMFTNQPLKNYTPHYGDQCDGT